MSAEAMAWAKVQLFDGKRDPTLKSVLRAMADYAHEDGVCFPKYGSLVEDSDLARETVIRAVARLVDLGLVEKRNCWVGQDRDWDSAPEPPGEKRQTSNVYRLRLEAGVPPKVRLPKSVTRGDPRSPLNGGGVTHDHPRGDPGSPLELPLEGSASTKRPEVLDNSPEAIWRRAVTCLQAQGGMGEQAARSFFGRLLSRNRLKAEDLAEAVANAIRCGSADPRSYLTACAEAEAKRRGFGGEAVGAVSAWSDDRWGIALDVAAKRKAWPPEWGPKPGEPGSLVPDSLRDKAVQLGLCHGEG